MIKKTADLTILLFFFSFLTAQAYGGSNFKEVKLPDNIKAGIDHLRSISHHKTAVTFNPEAVNELLSFVVSPKPDDVRYYGPKTDGVNSAYSEFGINSGLARILKYAFNPLIPSQVFRPSSVRYSSWRSIDGAGKIPARFIEGMTDRSEPVIIRGIEREMTTPDVNTGGYYEYGSERTDILMRHKGNNVFLSLTRQNGRSTVGRKGGVIGADDKWNYFYSGKEGLSRTGLGWVDSYIYSSLTLSVYYEIDGRKPFVKCGILKWLSAGWAGINVVGTIPIRVGLNRYARDFKIMMENSRLPAVKEMINRFSVFKGLSIDELKAKYVPYLAAITSNYKNDKILSRRSFSKLIKSGGYLNQMNRKELESALVLEEIKCIVGKNCNNHDTMRP